MGSGLGEIRCAGSSVPRACCSAAVRMGNIPRKLLNYNMEGSTGITHTKLRKPSSVSAKSMSNDMTTTCDVLRLPSPDYAATAHRPPSAYLSLMSFHAVLS